jgi:TetR/AcrR family transcriptional regulator, cholesterol catabolism regulator
LDTVVLLVREKLEPASKIADVPKDATTEAQRARRQRVVDAGLVLLADRDFEKVQMKDVAEEANVALGTVYNYFSSKDHLFAEVLIAWAESMGSGISRNPLKGRTDVERLTEVFHRSVRAFARQPQLAGLVATLETSSDPFASEVLARLGEATTSVYASAMHDVNDETARAIVRVVDAVLASGLRSWVAGHASIAEVNDRLTEAITLLLTPR